MRLKAEDCAVLVVDIQEKLLPVIADKEALLKNTAVLLEGLRLLGVPPIVMRQYPKGLGDVVPEVKAALGDYTPLDKLSFSAWGEEEIVRYIKSLGKKNILICGIEAHICVMQSIVDLKEAGYNPVLVCDCVGSRRMYDKKIALKRAKQEGATLTTAESVLFELLGRASGDTFKAISKLVK